MTGSISTRASRLQRLDFLIAASVAIEQGPSGCSEERCLANLVRGAKDVQAGSQWA
jgi:hypothetical protein